MDCKVGTVSQIKADSVVVLIERHSACSGCHARGACTSADKAEQFVEVSDYPLGIQMGEKVRLVPANGGGPLKAALFAYVIPIVLLTIVTVVLSSHGASDQVILLVALVTCLLYLGVLGLLRSYFARTFHLRAERVE